MTKKIFRSVLFVAVLVFFCCITLFFCVQYDYFTVMQKETLKSDTDIIAHGIDTFGVDSFPDIDLKGKNLYIVDTNGNIIKSYISKSDVDFKDILNVALNNNSEIKLIKVNLFENAQICKKILNNNEILICVKFQSSISRLLLEISYPIVLIFLLVIITSFFISSILSNKIVQPLNEIDLDKLVSDKEYYELKPMIMKLEEQRNKLKKHEIELQYKRDEFEIVTESLKEGLMLININGDILSINKAAADICEINKNDRHNIEDADLNVEKEILELIKNSYKGNHGETVIDRITGKFQVDVNPVFSDKIVAGVVVLIFDVTEKENSEKMRREFSANVSHELKTPLQSISGYAELLKHGLVKNEDTSVFGAKIYSEAHRMINLVEDIIHLSRLDEGAGQMPYSNVDLLSISKEVAENLRPEAENMNVNVIVSGEHIEIIAIPHLISGIIFNLCDNAIKYNKAGGSVRINISNNEDYAIVSVSDTGLGIPKEDFSRIFERFYRVDKSHSKEVGGTGLGLSIVKHAAIIHNAKIDLRSTLGEGTTITVFFPTK